MSIEGRVFSRYVPDFEKLIRFGFVQSKGKYRLEKLFHNGEFKAVITILQNGKIEGKVFDVINEDEFFPLRIENQEGGFVGEVRTEYENILTEIRESCFKR